MFKSFTFKLVLIAVMTLFMTACVSISDRNVAVSADDSVVVLSQSLAVEPIAFHIEPIELEVPELKVRPLPIPLKELSDRAVVRLTEAEIDCVAMAMYYEARGEKRVGQISVGYVILNRMGYGAYPKTACGVVYDKKHGCQFSWACGARARIPTNSNYQQVRQVAISVLKREVENPVDDSLFFRHRSVKLKSAASERFVAAIGQHRFFALQ